MNMYGKVAGDEDLRQHLHPRELQHPSHVDVVQRDRPHADRRVQHVGHIAQTAIVKIAEGSDF